MSKRIEVHLELTPKDLAAVVQIAKEMGSLKDNFTDKETIEFLEKIAEAFDSAAKKLK